MRMANRDYDLADGGGHWKQGARDIHNPLGEGGSMLASFLLPSEAPHRLKLLVIKDSLVKNSKGCGRFRLLYKRLRSMDVCSPPASLRKGVVSDVSGPMSMVLVSVEVGTPDSGPIPDDSSSIDNPISASATAWPSSTAGCCRGSCCVTKRLFAVRLVPPRVRRVSVRGITRIAGSWAGIAIRVDLGRVGASSR
ncbi:hypothetical protein C8R47DRAFT_1152593 [Mycena vitilis]|nr:hypothetical protein C8R47DRAFT_1152593 [Mycena vitilis]